ncbi:MAG: cadherin domain-containing protein, partial [Pirellulaceae bacterium]
GTLVNITAAASDADATNNTITYSLQNNDGGRFAIDTNTGVVSVAGAIDRETDGPSRNITVRATSSDGSFADQVFTININDIDEFNVGAVVDGDAVANAVDENAANGTLVNITAAASDADATTDTITYSLQNNDGGRFAIDTNTGVVTVAGAIDREADGDSRNITVRATSSDGSFTDQVFTITINDTDEFNVGAVVDGDAAANAVDENATHGTLVNITAAASDADATNNTITYSLQNNDGGRFAIDTNTGVVTVAGAIDREADGDSRNITVRATSSDGSFTDQVFTTSINDLNDNVPVIVASQLFFVAESAATGSSLGVVAANDADTVGSLQGWVIAGGTGVTVFAINAATGDITVADPAQLDHETTPAFSLQIRVSDGVNTSITELTTIEVLDNNESPEAAGEQLTMPQAGSLVMTVPGLLANDQDIDGDVISAVLVGNVTHGHLTLNPDGSFVYLPTSTYSGTDQFTYFVTDGSLRSGEVTVTIVVEAVAPGDGGATQDGGTESEPSNDKSEQHQESPPNTSAPTTDGNGATSVVAPAGIGVEPTVTDVTPLTDEPETPPAEDSNGGEEKEVEQWLVQPVSRQSADLQLTSTAARRSDGLATDEPTERFVSTLPLTVSFAKRQEAPSSESDILSSEQLVLGTTTVATTAFSIGYVIWLLRGGALLASLLASRPAWTEFDPLPILDSYTPSDKQEDGEALQDIVG